MTRDYIERVKKTYRDVENLCATWVKEVEAGLPDDAGARELFDEWAVGVRMANKHKDDERATQYMVECGDALADYLDLVKQEYREAVK